MTYIGLLHNTKKWKLEYGLEQFAYRSPGKPYASKLERQIIFFLRISFNKIFMKYLFATLRKQSDSRHQNAVSVVAVATQVQIASIFSSQET